MVEATLQRKRECGLQDVLGWRTEAGWLSEASAGIDQKAFKANKVP